MSNRNKRRYHQVFLEVNGPGPWLCHGCQEPVTDLFVHHVDEDETNDSPENLVAMHLPCHARLHQTGKTQSAETRRRRSDALRGKPKPPITDEHRQHLRDARLGKRHSPETRRKIGDSQRGRSR